MLCIIKMSLLFICVEGTDCHSYVCWERISSFADPRYTPPRAWHFENVLIILNVCLPIREFKEVRSSNDGYDMIAAPSAVNLSAF